MNEPTEHRFRFAAGPYAPGELEVASIVGSEAISTPFAFDVDAIVNADRGSIRDLLGGRARLLFHGSTGRQIDGIVTRIEAQPMADDLPVYRFHLAPTLWLLGLRKTSRIFQDMTVPEIVRTVLGDSHVEQAWGLEHTYPKREYCVQYRETDLAFITRLLAEEGIFYFFSDPPADNWDAQATVVFADSVAEYSSIAGNAKIRFRDTGGLERDEQISSFSFGEEVASGATLHRSFDFKRPVYELRGESRVGNRNTNIDLAELSIYEHDNDPEERQIHSAAAQTALAQLRARVATGSGTSTCQRLLPAGTFELWDHPHGDLCRRFVVVGVDHEVHQVAGRRLHSTGVDTYKNSFRVVPEHVAFRPKRQHRELHQVTETAIVVGPPGEEIYVDDFGRIKVQFHWDRYGKNDEHSSCWLRSMQPWAGAAWGSQFIPRIGMEVVVTFVGGDIDRPMVLGSVYNATHPVPYALPGHKTQSGIKTSSTPGGAGSNELRFEDAAGQEEVFVHAQKDFNEVVENNHTRTVKGDEAISIGRTSKVEIGSDQELHVDGNEVVTLNKNFVLHVVGKQIVHVDGKQVEGSGTTSATAPTPQGAPAPLQTDMGASAALQELLEKDIFNQQVGAAKLLFLGEQVPEEHYAMGQEICNRAALSADAVTQLQQDALALSKPPSGIAAGVPTLGELQERVAGLGARAKDVRRGLDQAISDGLKPGPVPLQRLQIAAIQHQQALWRRADRLERTLHRIQPTSLLAQLGAGTARGGGGVDPAPPEALSTPSGADAISKGPELPTVEGFENHKATMNIAGGPGTITAKDGFAIKAGSCEMTMKGGTLALSAASAITLDAPSITVTGTVVFINGAGLVGVKGGMVSIEASGIIQAMAGMILLNP